MRVSACVCENDKREQILAESAECGGESNKGVKGHPKDALVVSGQAAAAVSLRANFEFGAKNPLAWARRNKTNGEGRGMEIPCVPNE